LRISNRGTKDKIADKKYFQISTAIDYPSSRFHLGHAYEKICTDVLARWKKLEGYDVHFSTGTDCHGLKIQRAAEKAGKKPLDFVIEISKQFKDLSKVLNISYDDFIMTTEKRHKETVNYILKELQKNKEIYKGEYEGLYCVDCETYYTKKDTENNCCPIHKKTLERIKEESYFFKLSKYQNRLIKEISKGNLIWPKKKEKEILNRLREPLKDLSISRENVSWGIPLPFDKNKTTFVWVDALINYLSTINYPNKEYKKFWPATHFIGSDIVWHHTVIWYSILSTLELKLPKVIVHGFINLKGEKLSKAAGLTVDPIGLSERYSSDSLRYFLMRKIPFGEDGNFSEESLKEAHNNELANKLGNLVSRVSTLAEKYGLKEVNFEKINVDVHISNVVEEIEELIERFEFDKALNSIFAFIDTLNQWVQDKKIWETGSKEDLFELATGIKAVSILLWPFIPSTSEKIAKQFGFKVGENSFKEIKKPLKIIKIKKSEILFKKIK